MPDEGPIGRSVHGHKPFWLARSTRPIFFFAVMLTLAGVYLAFKVPKPTFLASLSASTMA